MAALEKNELQQVLEAHAPLALAEEWDNVGWIIEASHPMRVRRLLLAIDLTTLVLDEAVAKEVDVVLAYHPPIFNPLMRLAHSDAKARIIMSLVRKGISVYSPHTALDAAQGGVNDWLADAFGPGTRSAIQPPMAASEDSALGQGRLIELALPSALDTCVDQIKSYLGLQRVRVATANEGEIHTIALCAGAGGSVLETVTADLYVTGEMRHHDVLAAGERGTSVILCEHTNTERGFLGVWQQRLQADLPASVEVVVSGADAEPLQIL
jgi:dinuclear metal center YbgI/SA1388 family protein